MITKIQIGDRVRCLKCGETIVLGGDTFTIDGKGEYIVCPECGIRCDVQDYHAYGTKMEGHK